MDAFSTGDIIFIVLVLGAIHGVMLLLGHLRRRKAARETAVNTE